MSMNNDCSGFFINKEVGETESNSCQSVGTVYTPQAACSIKPCVGMEFSSIDHAFEFYKTYAKSGGFSVRKGGQYVHDNVLRSKYFVCSKEGIKPCRPFDSLEVTKEMKEKGKTRNRPSQRTGCLAQLVLTSGDGKIFKVCKFVEEHNHYLVSEEDMKFLPSSRNLTYQQMQMLCSMSKVNMGPVKAFNVMRTIYGGFEHVGCTSVDFKNFKKDLNLYIGEFDADMVVNMLNKKKEFLPDFCFEYSFDSQRQLTGLFWADEQSKRNYKIFGDVVSFDATFNSNKYKMVFVPFTGIDNHYRNVTLGAGLLKSETIESYSWLLTSFKNCFGNEPLVVVTDQDPAIKQAVASVLPNSRHRLCMWHIMKKLADKVGTPLCNNDDFKQHICNIVWTDSISPEEFESEWVKLIFDFNLFNHDWICVMYGMREMWIPAFYRDETMSGLMRTTSRSECENHFFGQVSNAQLTLLEFFSHFETAMESQRYNFRKKDHETRYTTPDFWTDYPLEGQAAQIYTRIFFYVQEEIYGAIHKCINVFASEFGDGGKFLVKDRSAYGPGLLEVNFNLEDFTILCSCKRFERYGLLCHHAFAVLRLCGINKFPRKYIVERWTRDVIRNIPSRSSMSMVMRDGENVQDQTINDVVREIIHSSEYIVNKLITDFDQLKLFRDNLKAMKEKTDEGGHQKISAKKKEIIQSIIGATHASEPAVRVPTGIRNKGCGLVKGLNRNVSKRLVGQERGSEIAQFAVIKAMTGRLVLFLLEKMPVQAMEKILLRVVRQLMTNEFFQIVK